MTQNPLEGIKPEAVAPMCGEARDKTWEAVEAIRHIVKPGMTEKQAIQKANAWFASQGVKKFWHKTHIRFGESTVLSFEDAYHDEVVLKEDDIFYVDIGPVWSNIEGDCGKTFALGDDPQKKKIARDVEILFEDVRQYWKKNPCTGRRLLSYAEELISKTEYLLHPSYVKGHRLSEFSHALYTKSPLYEQDFVPQEKRWVLEFQICRKDMAYGAFYEDLLF